MDARGGVADRLRLLGEGDGNAFEGEAGARKRCRDLVDARQMRYVAASLADRFVDGGQ